MNTMKNPAAVALGKIKSAKKASAARENGKLGGRPRYQWAVIDRLTGNIVSRHTDHWLAEERAVGDRFRIVEL